MQLSHIALIVLHLSSFMMYDGVVHMQLSNIAFIKTHKTASTTLASILYRYGMRHHSEIAKFDQGSTFVDLDVAMKQVWARAETGKPCSACSFAGFFLLYAVVLAIHQQEREVGGGAGRKPYSSAHSLVA